MYYARQNIAESGQRTVAHRILMEPKRLWGSKGPEFTERPVDTGGDVSAALGLKTASDILRSMSHGWRPRSTQMFRELEYSATIMGGIRALKAAGIWPWTAVKTDNFPTLYFTRAKGREKVLKSLTALAAQGARAQRDPYPPHSGFYASEYIRKQVVDNNLAQPAWALRGLLLAEEAYTNQMVRTQVEGAASTAISYVPIIGQIAGAIGAGMSARTKIEAERSKAAILLFQQMYEQGMEARVGEAKLEEAKNQLAIQLGQMTAHRDGAVEEGDKRGKELAQAAMVGSGVLFVGAIGISLGFIVKRLKERRKK